MVEYKIKTATVENLLENVEVPPEAVGITVDAEHKTVSWLEPVDLGEVYSEGLERILSEDEEKEELPAQKEALAAFSASDPAEVPLSED